MTEENKTTCRQCGEIKLRIQDGKFPDGKNKRWVDEHGKLWTGLKCPDCVRDNAAERQRIKRK